MSGKKRLYFLARDGYLMYHAAKDYCSYYSIPIECRYLYCSRYALRQGEYKLLGEESIDYLCLGGMDVTFDRIMERGGLDQNETEIIYESLEVKVDRSRKLTYHQIKQLKPHLKENPLFLKKVIEKSEKVYPSVIGYLSRQGMMDTVPFAIVDSGWTGSIQKSLQNLLDSQGFTGKLEGYYFGMYELVKGCDSKRYHTWYFAPKTGLRRKTYFCNNLFECIFSSPEGMTIGYTEREGQYVPVLESFESNNKNFIEESEKLIRRFITGWMKETVSEEGHAQNVSILLSEKNRKNISKLLSSFMGKPSYGEAQAFGCYLFHDDVIGAESALGLSGAWPEGRTVLEKKGYSPMLILISLHKTLRYLRKLLNEMRNARMEGVRK